MDIEQFFLDRGPEILELAQTIYARLGDNPENADVILDAAIRNVNNLGFDPYGGGRVFFRTRDEQYTSIHSPKPNGVIKPITTRTRDFIKVDQQSHVLARENRRVEKKKINSMTPLLPTGRRVSTLWHMAEGDLLNDTRLTAPEYEGGHVFLLLLEDCNLPFAIEDEVIEDVGIPPTLFFVRVEKVIQTSEVGGANLDHKAYRVTRVYAACLDNCGFITDESRVYDWCWSNAQLGSCGGWMCLGNNFASGAMVFPDIASIGTLPHLIISKFPTTGHYGTSLKDYTYNTLIPFMKSIKGKRFPVEQLKYQGTLISWLEKVKNDLYRR